MMLILEIGPFDGCDGITSEITYCVCERGKSVRKTYKAQLQRATKLKTEKPYMKLPCLDVRQTGQTAH